MAGQLRLRLLHRRRQRRAEGGYSARGEDHHAKIVVPLQDAFSGATARPAEDPDAPIATGRWAENTAPVELAAMLKQLLDANVVLNALPTSFSTPELNVGCAEGEPHRLSAELQQLVSSGELPSPEFKPEACVIDGLRIDWADGFGLIRASNTTPVLVLRFEGQSATALERIQTDMMALLRQVKPDAQVQEAAH